MQLILAQALDFQPIDSQVLRVMFPALVELTVNHQSYATPLALELRHILGFVAPHSLAPSRLLYRAPTRRRLDTCYNLRSRPWYDSVFQSLDHFRFQFTTF